MTKLDSDICSAEVEPLANEQVVENKGLFSTFPGGTLAALGAGTGVIALFTLWIEVLTGQWLATASGLPIPFISLPIGLATLIIGALTARINSLLAIPALVLGSIYGICYLFFH